MYVMYKKSGHMFYINLIWTNLRKLNIAKRSMSLLAYTAIFGSHFHTGEFWQEVRKFALTKKPIV